MNDKHLIYIGTPKVAADALQNLLDQGVRFDAVITNPDKKKGRKQIPVPSEVKKVALEHGIPVYTPEKIKEFEEIYSLPCDLIVTCAYGQILPKKLLDYPVHGCVNLHGSILPQYRGGAPVQRSIWNREPFSGVSLMKMEQGLDSGPVLDIEKFALEDMNTEQAFEKLSQVAADLFLKHKDEILSGEATYIKQDDEKSTYAPILSKEEEKLEFSQNDENIYGQILAFAPEPGAYVILNGKKLKILEADYVPGKQDQPAGLFEITGKKEASLYLNKGRLNLKKVLLEGKKPMEIASFVNGAGRGFDGQIAEVE